MSKYGEFLKAQGASEEEIKVLDTPVAARAYEKMEEQAAAAASRAEETERNMKSYEERVASWYEENDAKLKKMQNEVITSKSEAERGRAAILKAQELGLVDVAKDLGWSVEPPKNAPASPEGFDPNKFLSRDDFLKVADGLGDNLARLEDMVDEHKQLFPDKRLRVSDLRREALAAGQKDIYAYWEKKYAVAQARENAEKKAREAEIARWKQEGAKEKETELASKFGNPEMRPLVPSHSPFTKRPEDGLRTEQPWNHADGQLSNDRVARVTKNLMQKQFGNN
jgi:hypothetical protein